MAADDDNRGQQSGWPMPLHCEQCQQEIPPDEVLHPEGQDYRLAFCSPACHALWRDAQEEAVVSSHPQHSGRE